MVFQNNVLSGASGSGTAVHTIDQSIRFNDDDSPYLQKTYSGAGSRTTFTFSVWAKLGDYNVSSGFPFFNGGSGTSDTTWSGFSFYQGKIYVQGFNTNYRISTRLLRDSSSWYHIVYVWDTTNATPDERIRIYVNGVRLTEFSTYNNPGASANSGMNQAAVHTIGYQSRTVGFGYADTYMAEIVFLDGTATDCNSFGEFNSSGIWVPKDVSGLTFGTNGFHIDGRDSADLGDDESGQGNDYTTSGLAAHDQVLDSPTNNFCTISNINMGNATGVTLQNGNLDGSTSGTPGNMPASISLDSGKWYWEVNNHANGSGNNFGVGETPTGSFDQFTRGSNGNEVNTNAKTTTGSSGQIIGFKLDFDAGTLTHTTNGTSYSSTGSLAANMAYAPHSRLGSSSGRVVFNFGQDSTFGGLETAGNNSDDNGVGDFYYSVPSGFLAICTKNLGAE